MRWELAALNLAREIARIHGMTRDEVFESFVEAFALEKFSSDLVTHQICSLGYLEFIRKNPS